MFQFDEATLMTWIASYIWPMTRISAMLMVMVVIGSRNTPTRIRLLYAVAITIAVVPTLPPPPPIPLFSLGGFLVTVQQLLIGIALGYISTLVMQAFVLAGQVIGMQTSLGFASMVDPASGQQVPVIGQLFLMLTTLLFLAIDGHLMMINMVVASFESLPIGMTGLSSVSFDAISKWGGWMFTGALAMSISAMVALLLINFSFGIMTRAAPQLNIFAIGFPITMLSGILILWLTLSGIMGHFDRQWQQGIELMCDVIEAPCRS